MLVHFDLWVILVALRHSRNKTLSGTYVAKFLGVLNNIYHIIKTNVF